MYASGARAQEICDLTVGDVLSGTQGVTLVLHGKGGKVRRVGVPRNCANMLTEYLKRCGIEKQYQRHVFSSQTHEHMTVSCVEAIYAKYISASKQQYPELFRQKSYPPHSMRHTTASHMLEAGVPFDPIIDIASSVKMPIRQAMLFEYRVGAGRLLVCSFAFGANDPAAAWLRARLVEYASGDAFDPAQSLTSAQLRAVIDAPLLSGGLERNRARNPNDPSSFVRAGALAQP